MYGRSASPVSHGLHSARLRENVPKAEPEWHDYDADVSRDYIRE